MLRLHSKLRTFFLQLQFSFVYIQTFFSSGLYHTNLSMLPHNWACESSLRPSRIFHQVIGMLATRTTQHSIWKQPATPVTLIEFLTCSRWYSQNHGQPSLFEGIEVYQRYVCHFVIIRVVSKGLSRNDYSSILGAVLAAVLLWLVWRKGEPEESWIACNARCCS